MNKRKGLIVGVGFQKTGTSSLREALKVLGFRVKDMSSKVLFPILRGNYAKAVGMLKNYDAVEDTPWYIIYKEIDELVPNSKFVLTIRDEEAWYKSVKKHIGDLRAPHHEWIYGRGKGLPKDDKENTINVYNKHNEQVKEYFKNRPNDLLIIDFTKGEKWDKLCAFLDLEVPNEPFPHYNNTSAERKKPRKRRFKILRKRIKYFIKIKYIDLMGLWGARG
ncbi:MAG: sulfotransferase family protein [Flavobacteriales bacterium]